MLHTYRYPKFPYQRSAEQAARVALDDALIAEVQAHDTLVLGVPMYNFGVPVQLKTWIDAIARAGVTFRYTASGPEGLLTGKTVYVALARGGLDLDPERSRQARRLRYATRPRRIRALALYEPTLVALLDAVDPDAELVQRHLWLLAAFFGLIHGAAIAGALLELGLPGLGVLAAGEGGDQIEIGRAHV